MVDLDTVEVLRVRIHLKDERIAELEGEVEKLRFNEAAQDEENTNAQSEDYARIVELEGALHCVCLTLTARDIRPGRRIDKAVSELRALAKLGTGGGE